MMHASLLRGDSLRLRARRWAWIALAGWLPALLCLAFFKPLWAALASLAPLPFMAAAALAVLLLIVAPLLGLGAGFAAIFLHVEAICAPRAQQHPLRDRLILALGLLVSFTPAVAAAAPAVHALLQAPGHSWTTPLLWLLAALVLAALAAGYWRAKWRARRTVLAA